MNLRTLQQEWATLSPGPVPPSTAKGLADEIATSFLNNARQSGSIDLHQLDLLLQMASSGAEEIAKPATFALYGIVIEGLCNDFTDMGIEICTEVLGHIFSFLRCLPQGKEIDHLLNALGIASKEDLITRYGRLKNCFAIAQIFPKQVKKILVLSRVTIGADVVITSIILQMISETFPNAEVVVIGPQHLEEIFHGFAGTRCVKIEYQRYGSLFDRTTTWPLVFSTIEKERQGLGPNEILLFDPDSRLSQLGLLPLLSEQNTCYFQSRSTLPNGSNLSLTELTNSWLNSLLNKDSFFYPAVSFIEIHEKRALTFKKNLADEPFVIAINLGVGQNENKRVPPPFEEMLLSELLSRKNTMILLDSGKSEESKNRVKRLLRAAEERSVPTTFLTEDQLLESQIDFCHGIIGFRGSIGAFGALIKQSDAFFGYDSCCQHIATALDIPAVIAFAGAPNARFKAAKISATIYSNRDAVN